MDDFKLWAEYGSFHGVPHCSLSSSRSYFARKIWLVIFVTFLFICIFLQAKLLHEIIVEKPTVVDVFYERAKSVNFPNVVICDLNQERDQIRQFLDPTFGNTSEISLLAIQIAMNDLFEPLRRQVRKNVSFLSNFPLLENQFETYVSYGDPTVLAMQS